MECLEESPDLAEELSQAGCISRVRLLKTDGVLLCSASVRSDERGTKAGRSGDDRERPKEDSEVGNNEGAESATTDVGWGSAHIERKERNYLHVPLSSSRKTHQNKHVQHVCTSRARHRPSWHVAQVDTVCRPYGGL